MGIWQNFKVLNRISIRQAVSPIRKAVVADYYNPIAVITLSLMLKEMFIKYNIFKKNLDQNRKSIVVF
jgi:hypothetical protein